MLVQAPRLVQNLVDALTVQCIHCSLTVELEHIVTHEKQQHPDQESSVTIQTIPVAQAAEVA